VHYRLLDAGLGHPIAFLDLIGYPVDDGNMFFGDRSLRFHPRLVLDDFLYLFEILSPYLRDLVLIKHVL
jgi:hypothetical protein